VKTPALLLAAALVLAAGPAGAAPAPGGATGSRNSAGGEKKKEPIHITADRMEAFNQKNLVIFIGKVKAVQGEMIIQSDRLEVYVKKREKDGDGTIDPPAARARPGNDADGQDPTGQVERIIATGNVLINQTRTKFASGERLDYVEETGIGVLTGNPRAWEGQNQVIGDKIELFLKEDRTVVHGSTNRRVNVTLHPEEERPAPSGEKRPPAKGTNAPQKK